MLQIKLQKISLKNIIGHMHKLELNRAFSTFFFWLSIITLDTLKI